MPLSDGSARAFMLIAHDAVFKMLSYDESGHDHVVRYRARKFSGNQIRAAGDLGSGKLRNLVPCRSSIRGWEGISMASPGGIPRSGVLRGCRKTAARERGNAQPTESHPHSSVFFKILQAARRTKKQDRCDVAEEKSLAGSLQSEPDMGPGRQVELISTDSRVCVLIFDHAADDGGQFGACGGGGQ